MTKDEALRLALEAFGEIAWSNETQWQSDRAKVAITAIKAALEAKDEPWPPVSIGVDVTKEGTHVVAMRLRPNGVNEVIHSQFHPLAQLEAKDEPVAWWIPKHKAPDMVSKVRWSDECEPLYTTPPQRKPLTVEQPKVRTGDCLLVGVCASEGHKIQPQRTWVGLTIEEREQIQQECFGKVPHHVAFAKAIEVKLRSKNYD